MSASEPTGAWVANEHGHFTSKICAWRTMGAPRNRVTILLDTMDSQNIYQVSNKPAFDQCPTLPPGIEVRHGRARAHVDGRQTPSEASSSSQAYQMSLVLLQTGCTMQEVLYIGAIFRTPTLRCCPSV